MTVLARMYGSSSPARTTVSSKEVAPFFAERGLSARALLAAEGFAASVQDSVAELAETDPVLYQAAMAVIMESASDPALHGTCSHLLYIGQKE
jgi:hypothetical protein